MEMDDHRKTGSWGGGKAATQYQEEEQALIDAEKFGEAIQKGIDDLQSKGLLQKYNDAVIDMLNKLEDWMKTGLRKNPLQPAGKDNPITTDPKQLTIPPKNKP